MNHAMQESLEEQREVLNAWHGWILRELDIFKSKFRGAAATLLGAGDVRGFSMGQNTGSSSASPGWQTASHGQEIGLRCREPDQPAFAGTLSVTLRRLWLHVA
jgi:hypothetical protein